MMRGKFVILFGSLITFAISAGCKKEAGYKDKHYVIRTMNSVTSDVPLPDGLWTQIEKVADETKAGGGGGAHGAEVKPEAHGDTGSSHETPADGHGKDPHAKAGHGGNSKKTSATGEVPSKFMGIRVFLLEDTPGILTGKNYQLEFGEGGGELDLRDFLADKTGNFKVAIEALLPVPAEKTNDEKKLEEDAKHKAETAQHAKAAAPEGEHGEASGDGHGDAKADGKAVAAEIPIPGALKVFYLSGAVRRKFEGQILGGGCRNYYDITSFFMSSMKKEGIAATTTAARHVSTLSGTYFFAQSWGPRVYLSHLTIKDSRFKDLQCKARAKKPAAPAH